MSLGRSGRSREISGEIPEAGSLEADMTRRKKIALAAGAAVVVIVLLGVGIPGLIWYQRDVPEVHADASEHFKYGSFGAEAENGIPYWVWLVLPDVFPEHLPDGPGEGYGRFGFIFETDAPKGRPIGTSYREDPIPMVGLNCAVCHAGIVRKSVEDTGQIVLGMPAHQFDLKEYLDFLFAVGNDERFDADNIIPAIKSANPEFSWFDGLLYRLKVIPETRDGLLERADLFAWMYEFPDPGPGRVDTFNPYKFNRFRLKEDNPHVGTADLPPLWNQGRKEGMWLHWDGNNNSVEERNRSAALGAGASEESLDVPSMKRIADWIATLNPPAFPSDRIDQAKAQVGAKIYAQHCATCHAFDGAQVGQVVDIQEIGTDAERLDSFTDDLVEKMNTLGEGKPWKFSNFTKTQGYSNMPLDGVWLRAPYLHNGSVPTLRDLLSPPEERPTVFYRGYNVCDFENMGFVSSGSAAEASGFRFDTTERGNGNQGHLYGTNLDPDEIDALLEYLKTQ